MLLPDFSFEKSLIPSSARFLLGIDEVGRGPWAGPVTIGAFLLDLNLFNPDEFIKLKVRDSKKLSEPQRQKINQYFLENNFNFKTFSSTSSKIDDQGIAVCIYNLITQALKFYQSNFDFCLIDGNPIKQIEARSDSFDEHPTWATTLAARKNSSRENVRFVVDGDALCFSVAAASVVAKVDRDTQMAKYDELFPQYGFKSHKGYGTNAHLAAITSHGPCPIHRKTYKPIKNLFSQT